MHLLLFGGLLATLVLAAIPFVATTRRRESVANSAAVSPHATGMIRGTAEADFGVNFLIAKRGVAADSIDLCGATDEPIGPVADRPLTGNGASVSYLGATVGTRSFVASGAIAQDAPIYTDAGGKVTATAVSGSYQVGKAVEAVSADGDVIEAIPIFPIVQP